MHIKLFPLSYSIGVVFSIALTLVAT